MGGRFGEPDPDPGNSRAGVDDMRSDVPGTRRIRRAPAVVESPRRGAPFVRLYDVIWNEKFVAKLADKHGVSTEEAEEVLFSSPHIRRAQKGKVKGEHVYAAYGRTQEGRYLVVFFIHKSKAAALPISACDMTRAERRYFDAQKEAD